MNSFSTSLRRVSFLMVALICCILSLAGRVAVQAQTIITPTTDKAYKEGFEADGHGWTTGGTNSSWAIGMPAGTTINSAAEGANIVATNLTGAFNPEEDSYLTSPVFDLSKLGRPTIRFALNIDMDNPDDVNPPQITQYAFMEYSTDGSSWHVLGGYADVDWYSMNGSSYGLANDGWSGSSANSGSSWLTYRYDLSKFTDVNFTSIRFRLRFVALAPPSDAKEGIGFDNVAIFDSTPKVLKVTSNKDDIADDGNMTLREAIAAAGEFVKDSIVFDLPLSPVITLTSTFDIGGKELVIDGSGVDGLTISGTTQIFSNQTKTLTLSNLKFTNVNNNSAEVAGVIMNVQHILFIDHCAFSDNTLNNPLFAIMANSSIFISNSIFSNNSLTDKNGAILSISGEGIFGATTITNSSFIRNSAKDGGAIYLDAIGFSVSIESSTFSKNTATKGGSLAVIIANYVDITNSTFSGNSATGNGGAIYFGDLGAKITSSTITLNVCDSDADATGEGGGIFSGVGGVTLKNTILAGNMKGTSTNNDGTGTFISGGYNLIGWDVGMEYTAGTNDIKDDDINPVDAKLGPLAGNGGPTFTHLPLAGSPAIDKGDTPTKHDQRGFYRLSPHDIGAVEVGARAAEILYVNQGATSGNNDGTSWTDAYTDLQTALAEAIPEDRIWIAQGTYKPSASDQTASFTIGVPNLYIHGGFEGTEASLEDRGEMADLTRLSGDLKSDDGDNFANNSDNSYHVVTIMAEEAYLDGFTISGGNAIQLLMEGITISDGNGGGIWNEFQNSAFLHNLVIENNSAEYSGGGVYAKGEGGEFHITHTKIQNNRARAGGGVYFDFITDITLYRTNFESNTASSGGGLYMLSSSTSDGGSNIGVGYFNTFLNNKAEKNKDGLEGNGGGIYLGRSTYTAFSNLFAGNQATGVGGAVALALNIESQPTFFSSINSTIVSNSSADGAGGIHLLSEGDSLKIHNTILWGNTSENAAFTGNTLSQISNSTNHTYQNSIIQYYTSSGPNEINVSGEDPLFTNPTGNIFRLQATSPAIDKGQPLSDFIFTVSDGFTLSLIPDIFDENGNQDPLEIVPVDLAKGTRVLEGAIDMGAYERAASADAPNLPTGITVSSRESTNLTVSVTPAMENAGEKFLIIIRQKAISSASPEPGKEYVAGNDLGNGQKVAYADTLTQGQLVKIENLSTATSYIVEAYSYNGTGATTAYSASSASVEETTLSTEPVSQPTDLMLQQQGRNEISGSFRAPAGIGDPTYLVLRRLEGTAAAPPKDGESYGTEPYEGQTVVPNAEHTFTDDVSGLKLGDILHYDIYIYNGSGIQTNYLTVSPLSGSITIDFANLTVTATDATNVFFDGFTATWQALADATTYELEVATDELFTTVTKTVASISETQLKVTGLSQNTQYFYRVKARKDQSVTKPSNIITVKTLLADLAADRTVLEEIYTQLGGTKWKTSTNWKTNDVSTWHGITVEGNRVTAIRLPDNGLAGELPASLARMSSLQVLDITGNEVTGLPDLRGLPSLTTLSVANNRLDFGDLEPNKDVKGIVYSPQKPLGATLSKMVPVNSSFELAIGIAGSDNKYRWFRNGTAVDGATSAKHTLPALRFENMGSYHLEITSGLVSGLTLTSEVQEVLATADIAGKISDTNGKPVSNATGVLLRIRQGVYDTLSQYTSDGNGAFTLQKILLGNYLLSSRQNEAVFLPGYYKSSIDWAIADTIRLRDHVTLESLRLVNIPRELTPADGNNSLEGVLESELGDAEGGRLLARNRVRGAGVTLSRQTIRGRGLETVYELVAYMETSESGEFEVNNLAKGRYRLNVQYPGIPMDPKSFVEFDLGGSTGVEQSDLKVSAVVTPAGIVVKKTGETGLIPDYFKGLEVYPNPADKHLSIRYEKLVKGKVVAELTDINGNRLQAVSLERGKNREKEMSLEGLANGMYVLRFYDTEQGGRHIAGMRVLVKR